MLGQIGSVDEPLEVLLPGQAGCHDQVDQIAAQVGTCVLAQEGKGGVV